MTDVVSFGGGVQSIAIMTLAGSSAKGDNYASLAIGVQSWSKAEM